jgi:hypothetical protein
MKQPLCGENPTLGRRLVNRQSRAAGVSPPCERNASAMARVFPGASSFAHHGGLTPPALGCMCGCHCRYALRANEYASFPTGGLRPPLLAACADVIADTRFAPTSTHLFPRLAYASRSWCTESVDRKITTFAVHKRTFPRAAGVIPPCERNASAMARVFPGASTFAHHGGLTPPLLVACADVIADTGFAPTSTHLFPRLAYASRSWCTASVDRKITTFAVHKRTFPKSGGCHPAVVRETIAVR